MAIKWRRLGHVFVADGQSGWMHSHAMIPVVEQRDGDLHRVYFSPRDRTNRGHGGYLDIDMRNPLRVEYLHADPVLEPGALGCFDDSGALPNALVDVAGRKRLYYTGINLGVTVKIRNAIGVAEWDEESHRFVRLFDGPIIDRTRERPHFVATPEVHVEDGRFRGWFTSCVAWKLVKGEPKHFYHLEYAESADGIDWQRDGTVAVALSDPHEYALGVPRVIREDGVYKMWFCARATAAEPTYRIRYAESLDGRTFERRPDGPGLDVSESGWDSEMVCYPFILDHAGNRYMFYNGNGYGRTGFGIAVLEA